MKKKIWIPALLLLLAVVCFVNLPRGASVPVGMAEGERAPDFTAVCPDGRAFTLSEHRGKTVVVNLWATWCAPCVKELGDFDRLQRERPDSVAVLALHTSPVTEDVAAFAAAHGYALTFAADPDGTLSAVFSDSAVLPRTVIVSPEGTVTYNRAGALGYEALVTLIEASE